MEFKRIESMSHVPAEEQEAAQGKAHQKKEEEKVGKMTDPGCLMLQAYASVSCFNPSLL